MAFYVGQKVVFVGDQPGKLPEYRATCSSYGGIMPEIDEVYTIRLIDLDQKTSTYQVLLLNEIDNSALIGKRFGAEPGYPARCFRPAVERDADISIFKAMLNPSREEVSA